MNRHKQYGTIHLRITGPFSGKNRCSLIAILLISGLLALPGCKGWGDQAANLSRVPAPTTGAAAPSNSYYNPQGGSWMPSNTGISPSIGPMAAPPASTGTGSSVAPAATSSRPIGNQRASYEGNNGADNAVQPASFEQSATGTGTSNANSLGLNPMRVNDFTSQRSNSAPSSSQATTSSAASNPPATIRFVDSGRGSGSGASSGSNSLRSPREAIPGWTRTDRSEPFPSAAPSSTEAADESDPGYVEGNDSDYPENSSSGELDG